MPAPFKSHAEPYLSMHEEHPGIRRYNCGTHVHTLFAMQGELTKSRARASGGADGLASLTTRAGLESCYLAREWLISRVKSIFMTA